MAEIWERLEGEGTKAYEAFTFYRDLGVGRTFTAVAEKLQKSVSLIRRWKDTWNWECRADAWDNHITEKAAKQAAEDYAKMLELQINIGKMMQTKGAKALQKMDLDDVPIKSLPSIVDLIKRGSEIERTSRDIKAQRNNFQPNELTINIIPRRNEGEEVFVEE